MGAEREADLVTARLRLCAMSERALAADEAGDYPALGEALGCAVGAQWPPENWEPHVFEFLTRQMAETPEQWAWQRYIVLGHDPGVLVGNCNAFAAAEHEVEIGYAVLPEYQRRSIATEAVRAVLRFLESDGITAVRAHTYPHLIGSARVLEACGLALEGEGEEAGTLRYRGLLRVSQRSQK